MPQGKKKANIIPLEDSIITLAVIIQELSILLRKKLNSNSSN